MGFCGVQQKERVFVFKSSFSIKTALLCLGLVALAGCQSSQRAGSTSHIRKSSTVPTYMISVNDLGNRLGMRVMMSGNPYYELTNANNRVLLFMYENGRVYANGQVIASVGPVVDVNGTYYVSEILVNQIRPHLQDGRAATTWTPTPAPGPSRPASANRLVVIDPGHGGRDPGAISYLGHHEKDIVMQISRRLAGLLQQRGVQVVMTRQGDTFVELNDRADIANRASADLFVSIHADAHNDRVHRGFTVYVARSASEASRRAGRSIENALSATGIPSKGLRTADYRVLVNTSGPAVLIETGYLSNPSEAALLLDGNHQHRIAAAIADGILGAM